MFFPSFFFYRISILFSLLTFLKARIRLLLITYPGSSKSMRSINASSVLHSASRFVYAELIAHWNFEKSPLSEFSLVLLLHSLKCPSGHYGALLSHFLRRGREQSYREPSPMNRAGAVA